LNEVTIQPESKQQIEYLGISKNKNAKSLMAYTGYQIVTLVENPSGISLPISSFHLQARKIKSSTDAKLRVIFFENNHGKPGAQWPVTRIVSIGDIKNKAEINLDSLNLWLPPEGLFVG